MDKKESIKMKDKFIGYYKPSEADFKRMWEKGVFTFDTNFLLDFYPANNF